MADRTAVTYDADGNVVSTTTYPIPAEETNAETLRQQAIAAFVANRAFVNLPSPTNAQVVAQVKALSRQLNGVMRLLFQQFDGTD